MEEARLATEKEVEELYQALSRLYDQYDQLKKVEHCSMSTITRPLVLDVEEDWL
jgi:hypothetical protein